VTISVAIGTFNRAAMVEDAVTAALKQSRMPEEVIVSDDASTDRTWAVFERLAGLHPSLRVFRQAANLGGTLNANFAIGQTRGEFIAWCSDDDYFLPGHLEASLEHLEKHPEIGLVHSGFVDAHDGSEPVARALRSAGPLVVGSRNLLPYLIRYYNWPFHASTIVMRRAVWERVGPFDAAWALADTDWFVRAAEQFPVAMLPRHGVVNRRHRGNWSNRVGSARMQREIFEIVERSILRRWPRWSMRRLFWRAAWRTNVRLRLLVTLAQRLRTGHGNAACAAWRALLHNTGRRSPRRIEWAGATLIRWWCAGREPGFRSFSPL
jgi:glycosyltransferase involved in cell wall biosynthesis